MEPLVQPDVEGDFIGLLSAALPDVHVSDRVPSDRPALYVRVNRTGGTEETVVTERPLVMFECFAASGNEASAKAFRLVQRVTGVLRAAQGSWVGSTWLYHASFTSPVNQPDPSTTDARYTLMGQFRVRLLEA